MVDTAKVAAARQMVMPFAYSRLGWMQANRVLGRMRSLGEFERWVRAHHPDLFLTYRDRFDDIDGQFRDTVGVLGLDLAGKRVLDIGPGYGEAIDAAVLAGAKSVDFLELDPVFFHFNRLKGAEGHRCNQILFPVHRLGGRRFDVIWSRGSVIVEQFVEFPRLTGWWLRQLDRLAAPGGEVVVCPMFTHRVKDWGDNPFTRAMDAGGYERVEAPSERIGEAFPTVFVKRMP